MLEHGEAGAAADAIAPADGLEIVVDDAALRVSRRRGTSGIAVISFSGIGLGHLGGRGREQKEEFVGTLASARAQDNTEIFVIDRKRRWLNGIDDRLVPLLRTLTEDERAVVTLGNSMGGFAALWIAGLLPRCVRALAMSPQFSVHPEHAPKDQRWQRYRDEINTHTVRHAFDHRAPGVEYWIFFGADKAADAGHARLFRKHGDDDVRLLTVAGAGHEVARLIKRAGALTPLTRTMLREGPVAPAEVEKLLTGFGLSVSAGPPPTREARRAKRIAARRAERSTRPARTVASAPAEARPGA